MNLINNLFKKKEKKTEVQDIIPEEILSAVKKSTPESAEGHSFIGDFEYPINKIKSESASVSRSKPKEITPSYKETLKKSIVISLLDEGVQRPDLEFVGKSRVDGRPIYRYIGSDFSKFDLPYSELFSVEDIPSFPPQIQETIEDSELLKSYSDYLSEQLDRSIAYSEYVAETISKEIF